MLPALILAALSIIPQPNGVLVDHVSETEVNHFYNESGDLVFDQLIYREPNRDIRSWRLLKTPNQLPTRDWTSGCYVATWMDGELVRRVYCDNVQHTFSQAGFEGDPEVNEREYLPKEKRRELRSGK